MFLLVALFVFSVAYALSAVLAEAILTSPEERLIPAALRAAIGMLLLTTYFAAAWQLMSIDGAWILGLILLALYAAGKRRTFAESWTRGQLRSIVRTHLRGYLACLAAVLLFFAPLWMSGNIGPFTEGGGDITIYSDVAKLLTDGDMTAFGQPSPDFRNVAPNLNSLLDLRSSDRYVKYAAARDEFITRNEGKLNPPVADSQAYRAVADIFFTSVYYAPYAQFAFLSRATNYPVYYGVQAFLYATLLLCVWHFLARYGRRAAIVGTAMAAASHALVSVYYNGYSMQGLSMAICALTLNIAMVVRPVSIAGLRCYGVGLALVWLCYTHFLSLLAPLLLLGLWVQFAPKAVAPASISPGVPARIADALVRSVPTAVFAGLVAVMLASGSAKAVEFVGGLLKTLMAGAASAYLGDRITPFSLNWLGFLFGFVSQQHLPPFAQVSPLLLVMIGVGIAAGIVASAVGAALVAKSWSNTPREVIVAYAVIVLTIVVHLVLAQSSLYTQAKGAQNALVLLYCGLALPLTLGATGARVGRWSAASMLPWVLFTFLAALAATRIVYGYRLAAELDRTVILGASYDFEAERIRAEDPLAFVLFEPRKSADVYVSVQPFAGARMVPTRHLALQRLVLRPTVSVSRVNVSELIGTADLGHLWTLAAQPGANEWRAERLAAQVEPTLLLFADDYERDFTRTPRGPAGANHAMFSYLRNGAACLYLPAGAGHDVEATMIARDPVADEPLVRDLKDRLAKGELAADFRQEGPYVRLHRSLSASDRPRLVTIARFAGEYWLSVSVDGREIVSSGKR